MHIIYTRAISELRLKLHVSQARVEIIATIQPMLEPHVHLLGLELGPEIDSYFAKHIAFRTAFVARLPGASGLPSNANLCGRVDDICHVPSRPWMRQWVRIVAFVTLLFKLLGMSNYAARTSRSRCFVRRRPILTQGWIRITGS